MQNVVELSHVHKFFRNFAGHRLEVLSDINLDIHPGEFFVLLGPSGCGKSTLLRILSGLDGDFHGQIKYANNFQLSDANFVFQQFAILPWLTVEENVSLGLIAKNFNEYKIKQIVKEELKTFGLENYAGRYPKELSGGQKQRVGLARAFATSPKL